MSQEVKDAIAAELEKIERIVDTPVEPFGYGTDLWCERDLHPQAIDVEGRTTLALAQWCLRMLDTPRGTLPDFGDRGIDVRGYLHRPTTQEEFSQLADGVRNELTRDDRIDDVFVRVARGEGDKSLALSVAVRPIDQTIGGFSLTFAITDLGVFLEEIASNG